MTTIRNDHRLLEELFAQLGTDTEHRAGLLAEVRARLAAHASAEERYVYPAVARLDPDTRDWRGADEHREALDRLTALRSARGAHFGTALAEVVDLMRRHFAAEETEILPALDRSLSVRKRAELGRRFDELRLVQLRRAGIDDTLTREDLYIRAQKARIPGRSAMTKGELARALLTARETAAKN